MNMIINMIGLPNLESHFHPQGGYLFYCFAVSCLTVSNTVGDYFYFIWHFNINICEILYIFFLQYLVGFVITAVLDL